jgi:hypothetical protein
MKNNKIINYIFNFTSIKVFWLLSNFDNFSPLDFYNLLLFDIYKIEDNNKLMKIKNICIIKAGFF